MLDFLNQYSSAIQAISAVLMIIVTAILVWITKKYVRYTFEMVEEIRTQNRPYVFLDFDMMNGKFDLSISNLGNRVAHNVTFELINDVENSRGKKLSEKDVIKKGISYFPPQRRFIFGFDYAQSFLSRDTAKFLHFKIKYFDGNGKDYEDEFKYDLTVYNDIYFRSFSDTGSAISSGLKEISKAMERGLPNQTLKGLIGRFELIGKMRCPICQEYIDEKAQKCRYCGEWITKATEESTVEHN